MNTKNTKKIIVFVGTRPECIKTASLIAALQRRSGVDLEVLGSGQHPAMIEATLAHFSLSTSGALPPISGSHSLSQTLGAIRCEARRRFETTSPDLVIVQGDTSSAYAGALAARDACIDLVHVEAGLRTDHPYRPFPEEHFRRRIAPLAAWHFAPTATAAQRLLAEGVPERRIRVVGNTGIDALRLALESPIACAEAEALAARGLKLVTLTLHRRENYGRRLDTVCAGVLAMLDRHPELGVVCPVHPNPIVGRRIRRLLSTHPRILLSEPLPYRPFVDLLRRSRLVITDSGGIQEEAPYLGLPVVVVRENTERPEATASGHVRLIGADPQAIQDSVDECLRVAPPAPLPFTPDAPFGDGRAAEHIVRHLLDETA